MSNNLVNNLENGYVLSERYIILKLLYVGEMGIVYKGKDIYSDKEVTIKEFFPQKIMSVEQSSLICYRNSKMCIEVESFDHMVYDVYKELMSNYSKEVNNLKKVMKFTSTINFIEEIEANNTIYIIIEYVEGLTLQEFINSGDLRLKDIEKIYLSLINALVDIHSEDIIHGDLKPDNIFIKSDKSVVVGDFGISEVDESQRVSMIGANIIYSPPEILYHREIPNKVHDIYSLGKILEVMTETFYLNNFKKVNRRQYKVIIGNLRKLYRRIIKRDLDERLLDISVIEKEFIKSIKMNGIKSIIQSKKALLIVPVIIIVATALYFTSNMTTSFGKYSNEGKNLEKLESKKTTVDDTGVLVNEDINNNSSQSTGNVIGVNVDSDEEGKLIFLADSGAEYYCDKEGQMLSWSNPHNKPFYTVGITNTDDWVADCRMFEVYKPELNIFNLGLSPGNYRIHVFSNFDDESFPNYLKHLDIRVVSEYEFCNITPDISKDYYTFASDEEKTINWNSKGNAFSIKVISLRDLTTVVDDTIDYKHFDADNYNLKNGKYQLQISDVSGDQKSNFAKVDFDIVDDESNKPPVIINKLNTFFMLGEPMIITWEERCYEAKKYFKIENVITEESKEIELEDDTLSLDLKSHITSPGPYKLTLIYKKDNLYEYSYINGYVN